MITSELDTLFRPRSIAIIGASSDPERLSGRPLQFLKALFRGPIYPVNPNRGEVQGLVASQSIADIPDEIDLALVAVPAISVPAAIAGCGAKGVRTAIVLSSGFAEEGTHGADLQREVLDIARAHGMRMLGPNCMGVGNSQIGLWATFAAGASSAGVKGGSISVAAQSGAFGSYVLSIMRRRGLGVNLWAATGNQADIDIADCIGYFADDPATRVIFGYIEGINDGTRLLTALDRARQNGKPVIITKVGRSTAGAMAAASHTASLAGADAVYDAVFKQFGVYRADTVEEALDVAYACSQTPFLPQGERIGLISVSGGVGILMADAASDVGLDVRSAPAAAQDELRALLPNSSVRNPIDVTAQIVNDLRLLERCLEILVDRADYDSIVIFLASLDQVPALHTRFVELLRGIRERLHRKTVALVTITDHERRKPYEEAGYLVFEEPVYAIRAVAALHRFCSTFAEASGKAEIRPMPHRAITLPSGPRVDERAAKAVLAQAGISVPPEKFATTAAEAVAAATELGWPVVLKIVSPDIAHKSDVGGVALNLNSAKAVKTAYHRIMRQVGASAPTAHIEGVLVSPMLSGGIEIVLGIQNDPVFGPILMTGLGGVLVEVLNDVSLRCAPVSAADARRMLTELRGQFLLTGFRGAPPADIDALVDAMVRLSHLAVDHADRIDSIDVNPILVLPSRRGAVALDAVIRLKEKSTYEVTTGICATPSVRQVQVPMMASKFSRRGSRPKISRLGRAAQRSI